MWWEDAGKKCDLRLEEAIGAPPPGTQWPGIRPAVLPGPDVTDLDADVQEDEARAHSETTHDFTRPRAVESEQGWDLVGQEH